MTEIELALMHYDGDNSKPYCDLVWRGLKLLQLLGDTDGQSPYDVFFQTMAEPHFVLSESQYDESEIL